MESDCPGNVEQKDGAGKSPEEMKAPGKPEALAKTTSIIWLRWEQPTTDLKIDHFEIRYRRDGEKWKKLDTKDDTTEAEIPDLQTDSTYYFKVRTVFDDEDESQFSEESSGIKTDISSANVEQKDHAGKNPEGIKTPGLPEAVATTSSTIRVRWERPATNLKIDHFEIRYRRDGEKAKKLDTEENTNEAVISDLLSDSTYYFKVRTVFDDEEESRFSEESSGIKTDIAPVNCEQRPGLPEAVATTSSTIRVRWERPPTNFKIDHFEIRYRRDGEKWKKLDTDDDMTEAVISDLLCDSTYYFKVRTVFDNEEESQFSEESSGIKTDVDQRPGKPQAVATTSTIIRVRWVRPPTNLKINHSEIRYRRDGEKEKKLDTKDGTTEAEISDLQSDSTYYFKVRTVFDGGVESQFSKESSGIKTDVDLRPGKPQAVATTSSIIRVRWKRPPTDLKINHFEIRYRRNGDRGKRLDTKDDTAEAVISDLQSDSTYYFKVRTVFDDENESQFSEESSGIKTNISLAKRMKEKSTRIRSGYPHVYKLPITEVNASERNRKCTLLTDHHNMAKKEKTIMVVGATGAGKSTLIDGMVNYILGVAWEDDARFTIIDLKSEEKGRDQTQSQTEWITCYALNWMPGCQVDFHLNIIDTPGFGDTRGLPRDKALVDQIKCFFSSQGDQGIDTLDAVCFVAQAPLGRLTKTQQYIFDSILSVFGRDISSNIFGLITFADGDEPPVLNAMKAAKVPFNNHFVFNNSALFVNPEKSPNGTLFWKMGRESFESFFGSLNKVVTKSLTQTRAVLATREQLRFDISRVQDQITQGMQELHSMQDEEKILDKHRRLIEDNKNFEYQVEVVETIVIHTTFCPLCSRTCHDNCGFHTDAGKVGCVAMTGEYCHCCPSKCHWSVHRNVPFNRSAGKKMVTKTMEETKKQYLTAKEQKEKSVTVLDKIKMKFNQLKKENKKLVQKVRGYINRLRSIALKHNPLSEIEYIDMLIEQETNEMIDGYKDRVKMYEDLRKEAVAMQNIEQNKSVFPEAK